MTNAEAEKEPQAKSGSPGFRLERLEVFNWGTFDRQVWILHPRCRNILLTGEIGSGKSTLVDALTALLVPAGRITFNKAAGADARERTLRSYVLGYYKSERGDGSISARPIALRSDSSYSVILAVFRNADYQQVVTLAQVFWIKDAAGQPARFYAAHDQELSIADDFGGFGSDILNLRRRLRTAGVQLFDSYPPYGAWLRRRLGIGHEQALELFHQTVSMKSVGNLTDFIRSHMLEPFDVEIRIRALISHFDDLNRAHEAVLNAKRQMGMLQPLAADCTLHKELEKTAEQMRGYRDVLKSYFGGIKAALLDQRMAQLTEAAEQRKIAIERLEERLKIQRTRERELQKSIAENGGERIDQLAEEIRKLEDIRDSRKKRSDRYSTLSKEVGLRPAESHELFLSQRNSLKPLREAAAQREADMQNEQSEVRFDHARTSREYDELATEIESLKARRSNIQSNQIEIRNALCSELGISAEHMPFAGELIQVRPEETDWEGVIERMLHGFGLSLLVQDAQYASVVRWVEKTQLHGRLVYFRVRTDGRPNPPEFAPDSLANKLSIKPESPFYSWLSREIAHRYSDVICCMDSDRFRREVNAVTRAGQIKSRGERHEKDDRYRLEDRSRYILGWSNVAKIQALEGKARAFRNRLTEIQIRLSKLGKEQQKLRMRMDYISRLEEFADFQDLDWQSQALRIETLCEEKRQLETASDMLRELNEQLQAARNESAAIEQELEEQKDRRSRTEQRKTDAEMLSRQVREMLEQSGQTEAGTREALDALRRESLGQAAITVESCDSREQDMRQWLQARIDAEDKKIARLREKIIDAMGKYHAAFPMEAQEVDVSIDAADEYLSMLNKLLMDDLPRFENRFKQLLNENTIREVVNFQGQLSRERETIKERISRINESLAQIDYNPARYILLEAQLTPDADVRDFQSELRACTDDSLSGSEDDQYSESKFLQVKRIIERFRGREGQSEQDRRWTAKVTDVRNWFVFAASERWREDGTEYEHYSDSGGKSGGQKEKLAYTVLAASLAYQFGIGLDEARSRSFRFVAIDEAFGRGSDESAQYGLELFSRLSLQLLIVTPLQKIHIIEPFIAGVGFVHSDDGRASRLRNLTIEEYLEEKNCSGIELDHTARSHETDP